MKHDFVISGPPDEDEQIAIHANFWMNRATPVVDFVWAEPVSDEVKARATATARKAVPGVVVFHDGVEATP